MFRSNNLVYSGRVPGDATKLWELVHVLRPALQFPIAYNSFALEKQAERATARNDFVEARSKIEKTESEDMWYAVEISISTPDCNSTSQY